MTQFIRSRARGFQIAGLIVAVAVFAGVVAFTLRGGYIAAAFEEFFPPPGGDAIIKGMVLSPAGTPITFPCNFQGTPPPGAPTTCSIGVEVNGGPGTQPSWNQASTTDGSFSVSVAAGKYQIAFRGPPESIGQYTFPDIVVEIKSGETKDIGTIKPTEKTGRISGIVKDAATLLPVSGAQVNAFPMFGGPEEQGGDEGQKGPMMPIMATTGSDGTFVLKVDPGFYGINLMQGGGGPEGQQASPYVYSGKPIEAKCETTTCNVTGIEILATKADVTIQGDIVDEAGNPVFFNGGVGARPVTSGGEKDFTMYNGPIQPKGGFPQGGGQPTAGSYSVKVPSSSTQYTLTVFTPPDVSYSAKGDVTVTVTPNSTVTKNLVVGKDTSTIFGKVVSNSGFALSSCKTSGKDSDKFGGKRFGEVFAHNEKMGKFANAPIKEDCSFSMTIGAGTYRVGYHFNPQAGFINQPKDDEVVVPENANVEFNITVTTGDATISGQVFDADGKPMTNVWVDAGNEGEAKADFKSGGQDEVKGPKPGEFQGPGGKKDPQEVMKYCLDKKNEKECRDFKLPPGSEGPGGCKNMLECATYCGKNQKVCQEFDKKGHAKPQSLKGVSVMGQGYSLAKSASVGKKTVKAKGEEKKGNEPDFNSKVIHMGTQTDNEGKFSMSVVSGHVYEVRANLPPDKNTGSLIPPKSVTADLRTVKTVSNVVLSFRIAFGTMTGKVTMPDGSAAERCFVFYWNEAGDNGGSPCGPGGTYSLGYSQGKLHVGADSFKDNTPYKSDEQVVTITTEKTKTANFQLKERGFTVPAPATKTFDASQQETITLDNGASVTIPAGALAESGNVTVSVSPTVDLQSTEDKAPVQSGYTITATDENGQSITSDFNSNITIKLPYDKDYVEKDLGLNTSLLSTAYKDDTTGALTAAENATQDDGEATDETGSFTITANHASDWTIVSPTGVNLTSVSVGKSGKNTKIAIGDTASVTLPGAKANWNVGTAKFGDNGQLVAVSNKTATVAAKYRGKVLLYDTSGKLKFTYTAIKGFSGGVNQEVEDVGGKSQKNAPDNVADVIVSPATPGPAKAVVIYSIAKKPKSFSLTTGTGTGITTLSTIELLQGGIANLTTLFEGKTAKVWKMSSFKIVEAKGKSISGSLTVKNGKIEKKKSTPKVKKTTGTCSSTSTSKLTVKGTGFGATSDPIVLWNATSALAVQSFKDTEIKITVNPSAVDVKSGANTVTIVNSDGFAGVAVVTCGT